MESPAVLPMPKPARAAAAEGAAAPPGAGAPRRTDSARDAWLRELVATHGTPLVRFASGLAKGDRELAQDAVQDTFLRLAKEDPEKLKGREAAWLFAVCRTRLYDRLRKNRPQRPLEDSDLATRPAEGATPADELRAREAAAEALAVLAELPPRQREVVRLKFLAEKSYQEIAEETGLSVGNVGFILHHALKDLRARLLKRA